MAIVPKGARKRASKKSAAKAAANKEPEVIEVEPAEKAEKKSSSKSTTPTIPVPMFQAAPEAVAPKKVKAKAEVVEDVEVSDGDSDSASRRRRRGGRGRRRGGRDANEATEDHDSDTDEVLDAGEISEDGEDSQSASPRRRRRRRAKGDGVTPGETIEEDGVITVVKVREPREAREPRERKVRDDQPTRSDRGGRNRNRNDRNDRGGRNRNDREPRDFVRRRGMIITESEFLARRENVDRQMLVRQAGDRTQIAVLEDKIMVEHYVNRNSNISYVGNVYLGKVQNVLPSMEAAFVDIGKGRNAVLYAGEVNWDTAGLADGAPRKIEHVLKTGQSVLVQVTKDPIGQKGARLTSQISLPGRYLVYVPSGEMSGISRRLPDQERSRLKTILKNLIPEDAGVIVRTASEGASEEELERDVIRLKAQWEDIEKKSQESGTNAPALLYSEPDLTVRVIRDIFNEDFNKLIVQGDQAWDDINNYLGHIAPELTAKIEKWTGTRDLFVENRIEEQLAKAFDRKVYLPSGGSLVIDRT
ncbi:MAG: S1 RNA-binding domain-containing protein, partial [Actinobacteria bacterium]|nr:S1 RNA-binding domain-containing protein [Actinomycetota bacterium]